MTAAPEPTATWLPLRQQLLQPWRNGGGSTREVAIDPLGATVQGGFRWRVSIASVAGDGPFSVFPGIDRSLWLLAGAGMDLAAAGCAVRLARPLQRFDFAGEAAITATLLDGPTEDLSVMTDRGAVEMRAEILRLDADERLHRHLPDAQHLVLAIEGAFALPGFCGELGERDAVRIDGAAVLDGLAPGAPAILLFASFAARRQVTAVKP